MHIKAHKSLVISSSLSTCDRLCKTKHKLARISNGFRKYMALGTLVANLEWIVRY